jgi:hypothetical protein
MEAEKQKLINLRDRASELGEMKELKRIVEQLKELDKPETRQARLEAPLDIEVDPRMDPDFVYDPEAEEKEKKEKGKEIVPVSCSVLFLFRGKLRRLCGSVFCSSSLCSGLVVSWLHMLF